MDKLILFLTKKNKHKEDYRYPFIKKDKKSKRKDVSKFKEKEKGLEE